MDYSLNQIFEGDYTPEAAYWCNSNNAVMVELEPVDNVRRFQIQAVPGPTLVELQARVRSVRDAYLYTYIDPLVCNPLRWEELTTEEQNNYKNYRLYLLNYPQSGDEWYKIYPLTFDEWKEEQEDDD